MSARQVSFADGVRLEMAIPMTWLIVSLVLQDPLGTARGGTLRCYDMFTQIGTVAVREFLDESGRVEKEIFYDSLAWSGPDDCTPDKLRVQSIRTYAGDSEGRPIVEKGYGRDGRLRATSTIAYHGPGRDSYTRTTFGPRGELRSQTRNDDTRHVNLYFDAAGRVAAVRGPLPRDVDYAIVWGPVADGWSCGLGLPAGSGALGDGRIALHLRNHTGRDHTAWFTSSFDTDLRDGAGRLVPLTPDYLAREQDRAMDRMGIHVESGGAAFDGLDPALRYGPLAPGAYTLTARHPHPETAATLDCSALKFEVPAR
jgi:hypothetical protein